MWLCAWSKTRMQGKAWLARHARSFFAWPPSHLKDIALCHCNPFFDWESIRTQNIQRKFNQVNMCPPWNQKRFIKLRLPINVPKVCIYMSSGRCSPTWQEHWWAHPTLWFQFHGDILKVNFMISIPRQHLESVADGSPQQINVMCCDVE